MKFTAIDFETANASRASACAVGLSIVENGEIVAHEYRLIRPNPLHFAPMNVAIHGITPHDVADAPSFGQLWPDLVKSVSGPLVAHNASFDMSVLRHALKIAGLTCPTLDYFCTLVISRLTWPEQPSHALNHVAGSLNIPFRHHDAAEDARACALVALEACRKHEAASLYDLKTLCGLRVGSLHAGGYSPCGASRKVRRKRS